MSRSGWHPQGSKPRRHLPGGPAPRTAAPRTAALFADALALHQAGRLADAQSLYRRILEIDARHFDSCHHLGLIHHQRGENDAALSLIDAALKLNPRSAAAHNNRGVVLAALGRLEEAAGGYGKAIALKPDYADALFNRGNALRDLARFDEALTSYERTIALAPGHAQACCGRGNVLYGLGRFEEAVASFDRAIALSADYAEAHSNRAAACVNLRRYDEALAGFGRALALNPDLTHLGGMHLQAKMQVCDWTNLEEDWSRLNRAVINGKDAISPFQLLACSSDPAIQLACAELFAAGKCPASPDPLWRGEIYPHSRIRLAYLSADFRDHPVAYLTAGLIERHDRARFETTAISYGPDSPSPIRRRLEAAFDRFVDASATSDEDVARLVRDLEIDIAIDLTGFTEGARPRVLARRPAPVHVNYLGFSGTLGRAHWDYIVADRFVVPAASQKHFGESVVYLPDCFMANDADRAISPRTPSRAEAGLPEEGFVFCCFNNAYKITPDVFAVWMRLLGQVENSVLWLSVVGTSTVDRLRRQAQAQEVAPARLVFAPKVPLIEDHLARQRLADLFLDTLYYNAHATAADALWAGVPVLTCAGATFASRVAGSLLQAVGLSELITSSVPDYEALALALARDPTRLAALRGRLGRNRDVYPLFDTGLFTRHLEAAYTAMWERTQRGEPSRAFAVDCGDVSAR